MKSRKGVFLLLGLLLCGGCGEYDDSTQGVPYRDTSPEGPSLQPGGWMVEIAWDPNTEPDLVGYRLYHSPVSGHYTLGDYLTEIPAGTESYTIEDLAPGTHFWVLSAYDTELNESGLSEEISISLE